MCVWMKVAITSAMFFEALISFVLIIFRVLIIIVLSIGTFTKLDHYCVIVMRYSTFILLASIFVYIIAESSFQESYFCTALMFLPPSR